MGILWASRSWPMDTAWARNGHQISIPWASHGNVMVSPLVARDNSFCEELVRGPWTPHGHPMGHNVTGYPPATQMLPTPLCYPQGPPVGYPRVSMEMSWGIPWIVHGCPMYQVYVMSMPWASHGHPMDISLASHGHPMDISRVTNG